MPTPTTNVRIGGDLLDAARRALELPADAPVAQVIRAALLRLTSAVAAERNQERAVRGEQLATPAPAATRGLTMWGARARIAVRERERATQRSMDAARQDAGPLATTTEEGENNGLHS